jgi:hypothetical protein
MRFARFSGVISPGMNVRATMSRACTWSPTFTRTSPAMGSARRARWVVAALTFNPGV